MLNIEFLNERKKKVFLKKRKRAKSSKIEIKKKGKGVVFKVIQNQKHNNF